MDKRQIAKAAAKIVVATSVGTIVTKSLLANIEATSKLKTAEMAGMLAGAVAADKLQLQTDALVDGFFDRYEARRSLRK